MLNRLPGKAARIVTPKTLQRPMVPGRMGRAGDLLKPAPAALLRPARTLLPASPAIIGRPNAKINFSATSRAIGRNSSGAGLAEEVTMSQILDWVGSAAQGDILYRGSASWSRLAAGTSGNFLKTNGAGADPAWAISGGSGDLVKLTSGTVSAAATLDIVLTAYTAYRGLIFVLGGFVPATDGVSLGCRFSTDGGSSYDASGYNWGVGASFDSGTQVNGGSGSDTQISLSITTVNNLIGNGTTEGWNGVLNLVKQTDTALWSRIFGNAHYISNNATPLGAAVICGGAREAAQDTDAIRFLFSSGNIASGAYGVFGLT